MRAGGMARRAVVIQLEPTHEDVIESVRHPLVANGVQPVFVLNEQSLPRGDLFSAFTDYADDVTYVDFDSPEDRARVDALVADADLVVFNTFQINEHAQWARRFGKPTLGLVHSPRMFVSQSDCMELARTGALALITLAPHVTSDLISLDPVLFADTATIGFWLFDIPESRRLEPPARTRVALPGAIDFRNRDFAKIVGLVPRLQAELGRDAFEIMIPGSGPEREALRELVREQGVEDTVLFTELDRDAGFVRGETIYPELARSTFLLPLLSDVKADYRRWKISTALATAVGFSVPPILDRWTTTTYDLPCVTYRAGEELAGLRRALTLEEKEIAQLRAGLDEVRRRMKAKSVEEMAFALDRLFAAPDSSHRESSGADDLRVFLDFTRRLLPWSHSRRMQDAWVLWESGFERAGYFVELGAGDGVDESDGYLLERLGWHGVAAEPNPAYADQLRRNRTCQVSTKRVHARTGDRVTVGAGGPEGAGHEVETISLTDLLSEAGAPPVIDYLSLDADGSELAILRAHDFGRYRFRCITVEHNEHQRAEIHELLRGLGYRRKWPELSGHNDWYVIDDAYPDWSSAGREPALEAVERVEPFASNYSERFNHMRGYFGPEHPPPPMPAWGAAGADAGAAALVMARVLEQVADHAEDPVAARRRARRVFQTAANVEPVAALVLIGDRKPPPLKQLETRLRVAIPAGQVSRARLADRLAADVPDGELAVWVDATDVHATVLELGSALRRARVVAIASESETSDDGDWSADLVARHLIGLGFVPVARYHEGRGDAVHVFQVFVPAALARRPWFGRLVGRAVRPRPA